MELYNHCIVQLTLLPDSSHWMNNLQQQQKLKKPYLECYETYHKT